MRNICFERILCRRICITVSSWEPNRWELTAGYETFINKLTKYHQHDVRIEYHMACKTNGDGSMDETKVDGVRKNAGVS